MLGEGTYRLIRKMADGGMAEIFLAEFQGSQGFRKTVVLKRVRTALFADPAFRNMLIDEAHIAMGLNHGNIVHVLALGESSGRYFLSLELVDGWSLSEVMQRARRAGVEFPRPLALYVVAQIARALAYAHAFARDGRPLEIVHRDISPQNILLSEQGEVKLTDFGIARALSRSEKTAPGIVKGKIKFMSPEQTQAGPLDLRSDLFSLGIVAYQLIVGQLPFNAETDVETMARISAAKFVAADAALEGLEPAVAAVIARAMMRKPEDRYADADQMLADLERALRASFAPTGQSELKAWLASLAAIDGAQPISRVPVSAIDQSDPSIDIAIELHDSDLIPVSGLPGPAGGAAKQLPPPLPSQRKKAARGRLLFLLLMAAGAAAAWRFDLAARVEPWLIPPPAAPQGLQAPSPEVAARHDPDAWQLFPKPDAAVPEAMAPEPLDASVIAAVAVEEDAGAADEEVDEQALAAAVLVDAGSAIIDQDDGEPVVTALPVDAGPLSDRQIATVAAVPRPAEAPTVTVKIASVPPGAFVRLKSRVFGQTPINLRFRTGIVFELTLAKEGYLPATRRFEVSNKQGQEVWVPLKRAPVRRSK